MSDTVLTVLSSIDAKDWLNIILAIIGIIVSGGGLAIAIWQIIKMRATSEAVHKEANNLKDKSGRLYILMRLVGRLRIWSEQYNMLGGQNMNMPSLG